MTLDDIITALHQCREQIPGAAHPADAAAADYLIGRLRGDYAGGTLVVVSNPLHHQDLVTRFDHGNCPSNQYLW